MEYESNQKPCKDYYLSNIRLQGTTRPSNWQRMEKGDAIDKPFLSVEIVHMLEPQDVSRQLSCFYMGKASGESAENTTG